MYAEIEKRLNKLCMATEALYDEDKSDSFLGRIEKKRELRTKNRGEKLI